MSGEHFSDINKADDEFSEQDIKRVLDKVSIEPDKLTDDERNLLIAVSFLRSDLLKGNIAFIDQEGLQITTRGEFNPDDLKFLNEHEIGSGGEDAA